MSIEGEFVPSTMRTARMIILSELRSLAYGGGAINMVRCLVD